LFWHIGFWWSSSKGKGQFCGASLGRSMVAKGKFDGWLCGSMCSLWVEATAMHAMWVRCGLLTISRIIEEVDGFLVLLSVCDALRGSMCYLHLNGPQCIRCLSFAVCR